MHSFEVTLNERDYRRFLVMKRLAGFADKDIDEYLAWLVRDVELEPGMAQAIQRGTRSELAPMWMKNLAQNLPRIRQSRNTLRNLQPHDIIDRKCVVIGRGPSVFGGSEWWNKDHLKVISESVTYRSGQLTVVACDGILKDCLAAGVVPDYVTSVDGSPAIKKWYDELTSEDVRISEKPIGFQACTGPEGVTNLPVYEKTKAVISTQLNPDVVKLLYNIFGYDNIYWFQPASDDAEAAHSVTRNLMLLSCWEDNPDGVVALDCGGQVGTMSWSFSWNILKHRNVCLVGMDCGYPKGMPKDETYYWETALKSLPALIASTYYKEFYNPATEEWYYYDPVFETYRQAFFDMVLRIPQWLNLVNASSGTLYYPPHVKAVDLEEWLR